MFNISNHYLVSLDVGSNTILMTIFLFQENKWQELNSYIRFVGLSENLDKTKIISSVAFEKAKKVFIEYKNILKQLCKKSNKLRLTVKAFATQVAREATNGKTIIKELSQIFGYNIKIISAQEESKFTYLGSNFNSVNETNKVVIDIGGASTEIIWLNKGQIEYLSFPIGVVRFRDNYHLKYPINESNLKMAENYIQELLKKHNDLKDKLLNKTFVGVAGIPTTLGIIKYNLQQVTNGYQKVHNKIIYTEEVKKYLHIFLSKSFNDLVKEKIIDLKRVSIMPSGCLILYTLLNELQIKALKVSIYGLRYGIIPQN